ncbi:MAG: hypothetical protein JNM09_30500 [Blastocatellia bacterium]|nr:hypothetical protein [Blastocatellia bacterium]
MAIELGEYALDVSILGDAVSVTLHHFGACTICNLGYFDQAWAMINEGLSLAKKSKHPFTLGRANCATGTIHCYRKEYDLAVTLYDEVFSLAKEYDVGTWLDYAYVQRSVAVAFLTPTAQSLDQVRQCNQMLRVANVSLELPMSLIWQAEICGLVGQYTEGVKDIDEVLALIEQTGERNWLSEAWRVKGELLLKANGVSAQVEAENCYQTANTVAQQQSAKQFELRATTSLARLWLQQGKAEAARERLAEIYGWFTEGFDTADLQEAKALLEELTARQS